MVELKHGVRYVLTEYCSPLKKGDVVTLVIDDHDAFPLMKSEKTGKEHYIMQRKLKKFEGDVEKMTKAKKIVGREYVMTTEYSGLEKGDVVKLRYDDGSGMPSFEVVKLKDRSIRSVGDRLWIRMEHVKLKKGKGEAKVTKKIVGAIYEVLDVGGNSWIEEGELQQLIHDDETHCPRFKNIETGNECYINMDRLKFVRDFKEGDKVRFIKKPSKSKTKEKYNHLSHVMLNKGDEGIVTGVSNGVIRIGGFSYSPKDLVLVEREIEAKVIDVQEGNYYKVKNTGGHAIELGSEVYVLSVNRPNVAQVVGIENSDAKKVIRQTLPFSHLEEI